MSSFTYHSADTSAPKLSRLAVDVQGGYDQSVNEENGSLVVRLANKDRYLSLHMSVASKYGRDDKVSGFHVGGGKWEDRRGFGYFGVLPAVWADPITKIFDLAYQDPVQKVVEEQDNMSDADRKKSLQYLFGDLKVEYEDDDEKAYIFGERKTAKEEITGEHVASKLNGTTSISLGNINKVSEMAKDIPKFSDLERHLSPFHKGMLRFGVMLHSSVIMHGTEVFDSSVLRIMKNAGLQRNIITSDLTPNLLMFFDSIPKTSDRYASFIKKHWDNICEGQS